MTERLKLKIAVYAVLIQDDKVLLTRRFGTGWQDGNYSLPAGHLEENETLVEAVAREAKEEIGVDLDVDSIRLVHTMHRQHRYIDFFFTADWKGDPQNLELDKCDDIRWFAFDSFPNNMVPSVRYGLNATHANQIFSELPEGYDGTASPSRVEGTVV